MAHLDFGHQYSLCSERRLRRRSEFVRFFQGSESYQGQQCRFYRIPNHLGHFRLGITLKIKTSSVCRNQIKRAVREAMRKQAPNLGSYDYNVVVQPSGAKFGHHYAQNLYRNIYEQIAEAKFTKRKYG